MINSLLDFVLMEVLALLTITLLLVSYLHKFYKFCDKRNMPEWFGVLIPISACILVIALFVVV